MVRLLEISGTHYQMGWQHGRQVRDLRPLILDAIQNRLASMEGKREIAALLEGLLETLREVGGIPTSEMIRGQADGLETQFVDTNPPETKGNSFHRHEKLDGVLRGSHGKTGVELAQRLMAFHGGPLNSICRHQQVSMGKETGTISTAIYLPAERKLLFCHGRPCEEEYEVFSL